MKMMYIERNPDYLISFNPAFLIIHDKEEYVFYNSISHVLLRLSYIEFLILDLYYTFRNKEFIISKLPKHRDAIVRSIDFIIKNKVIETGSDVLDHNRDKTQFLIPSSYYIHLTYACNLKCNYCYNKDIRENQPDGLVWEEWRLILDKIIPHAQSVVFTGGECFLSPILFEAIRYLRHKGNDISISCISNGMHDLSRHGFDHILGNIDQIKLSCDSLRKEGERKGFIPSMFVKNVEYIRQNFPKIKIAIAPTIGRENISEVKDFEDFCMSNKCNLDMVLLLPQTAGELELCSDLNDQLRLNRQGRDLPVKANSMHYKRERCKAGKSVCSIDNAGNVYPCQSLHYEEFKMGNLLNQEIGELSYIGGDTSPIPSVDSLMECSKCKVKYICGGGCLANGYHFHRQLRNSHLVCPVYFENAITRILNVKTRIAE